ncbi:hypothetical protein GCM10029978_067260 [Actinoallomurus acanthiterrae]
MEIDSSGAGRRTARLEVAHRLSFEDLVNALAFYSTITDDLHDESLPQLDQQDPCDAIHTALQCRGQNGIAGWGDDQPSDQRDRIREWAESIAARHWGTDFGIPDQSRPIRATDRFQAALLDLAKLIVRARVRTSTAGDPEDGTRAQYEDEVLGELLGRITEDYNDRSTSTTRKPATTQSSSASTGRP